MNSEFNKAMHEIIIDAIGIDIENEVKEGNIDNLPNNFEIVNDFQIEVYKINNANCEFDE